MTAPSQSPADLVTRLRRIARGYEPDDYGVAVNLDEAADEIDRLTEEVARLRIALREIAVCWDFVRASNPAWPAGAVSVDAAYRMTATARAALPKETT